MKLARSGISLGLSFLVFTCCALAQTKPSQLSEVEIKARLQSAAGETNLRTAVSQPFHLRVSTKSYAQKGKDIEGVHEMWWVSPSRWRIDYTWGGATSVSIADTDKMWAQGEDTNRWDSLRVTDDLGFWPYFAFYPVGQITHIRTKKINNSTDTCFDLYVQVNKLTIPMLTSTFKFSLEEISKYAAHPRTICLSSASGLPDRIFDGLMDDNSSNYRELADYEKLGGASYPQTIRQVQGNKPEIDLHVDVLETFDPSQSTVFKPPPGASYRAWCEDMSGPFAVSFGLPQTSSDVPELVLPSAIPRPTALFFEVDETGRTESVKAFTHGGPVVLKPKVMAQMMNSTFKPATCHGTPVPGEVNLLYP
jgi:hypothetical protein